jgi:site-specific recombinase XerD
MPAIFRKGKWYTRYKINGKTYRKVTDATSEIEANKICEQRRQETLQQLAKSASDVEYDVAMAEFLTNYCGLSDQDGYLQYRPAAVKRSTAERYLTSSRMLHPFFSGRFLLDIEPYVISEYVEYRRETGDCTDATILRDLTPLSRMFEFSRNKHRAIKYNPIKAFDKKYLKNSEDRIRFLTEGQINTVLHNAKLSLNVDLHDQVLFSLETGLRWNEQFSAKWEHFRMSNKGPELLIPKENSKTSKHRVVPLTSKAHDIILRRQAQPAHFEGYIFWSKQTGDRVKSTRSSFETCLDRSKVTDFVWHDLRHTFATRALSKGMRIEYLSKILGHSKISTTEKYAHVMPSDLHDAMQAVSH